MRKLCVVVALCLCASVGVSAGDGWKENLGNKFRSFVGLPEKSNGAADVMHGYERGTAKYNLKVVVSVLSPATLFFRVLFHEVRKDLQENYGRYGK